MASIGENIRQARIHKGLTQAELAAEVKTTKAAISRYESNSREPRQDQLKEIADALGVSVAYLEGYESMEVRAIMEAVARKDAREFERLLGLKTGSIKEEYLDSELREGESLLYVYSRNEEEYQRKADILSALDQLNPTGQQEAVKRVEELTEIPKYQKAKEPPQPE